jgi:hypothetical protein
MLAGVRAFFGLLECVAGAQAIQYREIASEEISSMRDCAYRGLTAKRPDLIDQISVHWVRRGIVRSRDVSRALWASAA